MRVELSSGNLAISSMPVAVLVGLGVVAILEVTLDVIALVDLYRRPVERVSLGNKWVWVAIIVLVNLVGAILYLVLGRTTAPLADEPARTSTVPNSQADIGDVLYGPRDDSTEQ